MPQSISAPESGVADATGQRQIDSHDLKIAFWNSIKNNKSSRLFDAYLNRYPDGIFADLAKINIEELRTAVDESPVDQPDDKTLINDDILLAEIRDRLYELNYDPGPINGPMGDAAYQAIREFQISSKMPLTGEATNGLLRRLREIGGRKPWGTIVYAKGGDKWGISWGHASRKEAVASARASCGNPDQCSVELSFFGLDCGAFAYSVGAYALVARDSLQQAKAAALADCKARANHCRIIASVCATGEGAAIR